MKNFLFLFLMFLTLVNFEFFGIPKPKSSSIGAIVGKIYQEFDRDWTAHGGTMAAGKYYIGDITIVNNANNKEYTALTNLGGFYYFVNMEPGEYSIKEHNLSVNTGSVNFTVKTTFKNENINVTANKITVVKTYHIYREVLPTPKDQSDAVRVTPMKMKFVKEENFDEMKEFFIKLDFQKTWKDFEVEKESVKTSLSKIEDKLTYLNNDIGFKVLFPDDWKIETKKEDEKSNYLFKGKQNNNAVWVVCFANKNSSDLLKFFKIYYRDYLSKKTKFISASISSDKKSIYYSYEAENNNKNYVYYGINTQQKDYLITMLVYATEKDKEILKTFTENAYFLNDEKWEKKWENIQSRLENLELEPPQVENSNLKTEDKNKKTEVLLNEEKRKQTSKSNSIKEISYDDGISDHGVSPWSSKSNVGVAVLFTLPEKVTKIRGVKVFITNAGKFDTPFKIRIMDVNEELFPGKDLLQSEVLANAKNANEWVTVDLSGYNLEINQKNIFVAVEWTVPPGEKGQNAQFVGFSIRNPQARSWMNNNGTKNGWILKDTSGTRKGNLLIRLLYDLKSNS